MADDIKDLSKYIKSASEKTVEKLKRALIAGGNAIVTKARQNITTQKAIDTGTLRNSVVSNQNFGGGNLEVVVGPTVDYGVYVEYGTSKMRDRPYLIPAFNVVAPRVEEAMQKIAREN